MKVDIRYCWLFFVLLLVGCMSLPIDTLNKQIAVFEVSYAKNLSKIDNWINEKRFTASEIEKIQEFVRDMRNARAAMYVALNANDIVTAQGKLGAASASLQLIRNYLVKE